MRDPPSAEYRGIRFTADRIAILDGHREAVTVPLGSVRSLTLRRGFTAARRWAMSTIRAPSSSSKTRVVSRRAEGRASP